MFQDSQGYTEKPCLEKPKKKKKKKKDGEMARWLRLRHLLPSLTTLLEFLGPA
jgi:hypothetical protein